MAKTPIMRVPFPMQTEKTAARMLRGHKMGSLRDGWLLLYEDEENAPTDDLVGKLCIVQTASHEVLVRFLQKGRRPGTWDLLTATGEPTLDAVLIWAARVSMVIPYEPTDEEGAALGVGG